MRRTSGCTIELLPDSQAPHPDSQVDPGHRYHLDEMLPSIHPSYFCSLSREGNPRLPSLQLPLPGQPGMPRTPHRGATRIGCLSHLDGLVSMRRTSGCTIELLPDSQAPHPDSQLENEYSILRLSSRRFQIFGSLHSTLGVSRPCLPDISIPSASLDTPETPRWGGVQEASDRTGSNITGRQNRIADGSDNFRRPLQKRDNLSSRISVSYLNTSKTREIIVDFRRSSTDPAPLYINGERVERVHTFRYLGVHISNDFSWTVNTTSIIKKAQQRLHFLRVLGKYNLKPDLLLTFYRSSIESLLTYCITVWYGSCTAADRERLQRVVKTAQKIIGRPLPSLTDIYTSRCLNRASAIIKDSTHPGSDLFHLLPSGKRYRCIKTKTNRLKNSFFPRAITILNGLPHCPS
ncbi:uncharacterized protein [Nerophis lumbriciformis]|uniref:uncharacterized protein n=1 Tax=Nerophis lumbriciformis TaxID=546530 RepID=UPI003BAD5D4A